MCRYSFVINLHVGVSLLDEEERAPLLETFDGGLFLFYTSSKRKLTAWFDMDRRWDYGI